MKALLVAIGSYEDDGIVPLASAKLDIQALAKSLRTLPGVRSGDIFVLTTGRRSGGQPSKESILSALARLRDQMADEDFLFYFSGHGATRQDSCCLILHDAKPANGQAEFRQWTLSPTRLAMELSGLRTAYHLVVLDCWHGGVMVAQPDKFGMRHAAWDRYLKMLALEGPADTSRGPGHRAVLCACCRGQWARARPAGQRSAFGEAFQEAIVDQGGWRDFRRLLESVDEKMAAASRYRGKESQRPELWLGGDAVEVLPARDALGSDESNPAPGAESEQPIDTLGPAWTCPLNLLSNRLEISHPKTPARSEEIFSCARCGGESLHLGSLEEESSLCEQCAVGLERMGDDAAGAKPEAAMNVEQLKWAWRLVQIPAGSFLMGSDESELEQPVHRVSLGYDFWIMTRAVTQRQWWQVMGSTPWETASVPEGDHFPAVNISWDRAREFVRCLNQKTGGGFRFPSEAEWEYACRAGSQTRYCFGDEETQLDEYAWHVRNADLDRERYPHEVGRKRPNEWGLYDMHGNVWEFCADPWQVNYEKTPDDGRPAVDGDFDERVIRGGCWGGPGGSCRSASRNSVSNHVQSVFCGFRLVWRPRQKQEAYQR